MSSYIYCKLLSHLMGRVEHATVLSVLLYRHAGEEVATLTYREISALCMTVSRDRVSRTLDDLIAMGLVEQRYEFATSPRKYRVDMDRLEALLREPLPDVPVIPGITAIPAFDELAERLSRPVTEKETK